MDTFEAISQALGLAIASGLVIGAVVPPIMPPWGAVAGAVPLGLVVAAASLSADSESVGLAIPVALIGAGLAAYLCRSVMAGAARRGGPEAGSSTIAAIVTVSAALVALLSFVVPYVSLLALAVLAFLVVSRRRRAAQKHEGLRVLR